MALPILPNFGASIDRFDWYQRIAPDYRYETPGESSFTAKKFPMLEISTDMTGKSVLDIGCSEGIFARETEHRGARRIIRIYTTTGRSDKNAY
jgi:2-polyprenyl-3-methyl-5-hydroxy-6-metoxy-1,4-benzoquinol methylase